MKNHGRPATTSTLPPSAFPAEPDDPLRHRVDGFDTNLTAPTVKSGKRRHRYQLRIQRSALKNLGVKWA